MSRSVTVQTNKAKQEKCAIVQEIENRKHFQMFGNFRLKPCFKIGSKASVLLASRRALICLGYESLPES